MAETIANQNVSRVLGRLNEWYDRMAQAGLTFDDLQAPITNPAFRKRLTDFWLSGATIESSDQVRAREIMGHHFYGTGDLIRYFKDGFEMYNSPDSENYQDWLAKIPFSEQQLDKYCRTHILFPGYKEFNLRWLFLNKLKGHLDSNDWRNEEPYVNKIFLKDRWYLLRLKPLPGSENKTFEEQLALLPETEEVPSACVVTLGLAYYYSRNNHFPYTDLYLNCIEFTREGGERVFVGIDKTYGRFSNLEGLWLREVDKDPKRGLATMVKLPAN